MQKYAVGAALFLIFMFEVRASGRDPDPKCDCGVELPKIFKAEQVKAAMGKRVVVYGEVKRIPMSKGKGRWRGTGVVLTDGTVIYVTYGDPPSEWGRFLDTRVCVRGRLLNWSSLTKQSIVGPHLSELDFPVQVGKQNRPLSSSSLAAQVGRYVELAGTARDAKGGAVLLTKAGEPIYIEDLASWPEKLHGKRISAKGTLQYRQYLPEARVDATGAISQGAKGKQYVLQNACWEAK
jgi:hypothetical protein